MTARKTAPAEATTEPRSEPRHSTGLSVATRARVLELVDEWADQGIRTLPLHEHLREKLADEEAAS